MTLADIRDWLKTLQAADNYYIGRLDEKKEKSLGVYDLPRREDPVTALGGMAQSSYDVKNVSLLLHWNRNAAETEAAARRLWQVVSGAAHIDLPGGAHIQFVRPLVPAPISVDTDRNGVYEYVIEMKIFYRR